MSIRTVLVTLLLAALPLVSLAVELESICRYCGGDHLAEAQSASTDGPTTRKYAPDRLVDVLHLKIDVTPDFKKRTVAGTTTIRFAPIAGPVEEVTLDAEMLDVSHIEATVPLADYVATDHHITLLFAEPIPVGQEVEVAITYTAQPNKGLYYRTPELGYPAEDTHLWTQGETHEARHWFPCFDYPNERSTTEVLCTVPAEMTVLSNGRRIETIERDNGLKTVHWLQDKPHVSYLVCLVAGYFHKLEAQHGDLPLGFYAQPTLAEHAANSFADTPAIIAYFEEEIGLKFPWDKYDQVTIRDFNAGGMENTTLTTLTHRTIFSPETENIRSSRNLDAHETAHQWFGDYVTCEDWSHLWLNEGFATYYTHLYNEHKLGRDELLYGLWQDATRRVLTRGDDLRPIVYRGYDNAWEQFDFRAYPKGSWVLHMLRSQLGVDLYRQGIKGYLEDNALSSVVTADLIAALEKVTGKELDRFFDQWVYHAGHPKLKITHKWLPKEKLSKVTVEQTQEVNDKVLLFEFPTVLRFWVGDQVVDHPVTISKQQHQFYVPLAEQPTLVRLDPEYTVLAEVNFDKPQKMLFAQLANQDDVIGRLLAVEALAKKDNQKAIDALKDALQNDPYYGVRVAAADALGKLGSDEAFEALLASRGQDDARVRQDVVRSLGQFYRPEALQAMVEVMEYEQNPAIVATAVRAIGKFSPDQTRGRIETALGTESFGHEIATAAIAAMGQSGDEALRGRLLTILKSDRTKFTDRDYAAGLEVLAKLWRDADDKRTVRTWIEECLRDPASGVRSGAIAALGELGDPQAIGALQTFASLEGRGRNASSAKKAIAKLEKQAPFVPSEVRELRKLVTELRDEQEKLRKEVEQLKGKSEAVATGANQINVEEAAKWDGIRSAQ